MYIAERFRVPGLIRALASTGHGLANARLPRLVVGGRCSHLESDALAPVHQRARPNAASSSRVWHGICSAQHPEHESHRIEVCHA